jgi:glucokinase
MTMIGIDLGGTRIKLAEVDGSTVVRSKIVHTPAGEPPARVLDAIAEGVRELDAAPRELGMAIPGEVDASGKCWRLPNIRGFEGVEIAAELSRRTGARVTVENDGTTAAYGEALYGLGKAHASFLMVTLGTGIGGGLVIDRRLVRGAHGFAAEIGHVAVDSSASARPCVCGNRGCLEAYAGTLALLDFFRSAGGTATEVREVADSARRGEPAGRRAFDTMARALATALNSIQNVLDLDAIVFTGGISKSFDLVEPGLRSELRARCFARPLGEVPLLVSELGELAGVVGAAHLPGLQARAD